MKRIILFGIATISIACLSCAKEKKKEVNDKTKKEPTELNLKGEIKSIREILCKTTSSEQLTRTDFADVNLKGKVKLRRFETAIIKTLHF